jgi:glyoxylase-like metal-dependent hydrolase (beta-lactamase superfamily II)
MTQINLVRAKGNSFFCDGVFSVGVYMMGKKAILIDSGISKEVAKEIDKTLTHDGVQVVAIINTHCHGDHCGGNAFFQHQYPQIKIFSTESERPFIEDPLLAPICFCDGASPFEEMKKYKPITPQQPCTVTDLITPYQDQKIHVCGEMFEIITLPGHTRGMIAVKTKDNVLYCGDAIFGEEPFKKYPVLFYTCIQEALSSCKKLRQLCSFYDFIVAYHRGIIADVASLIDAHELRICENKDTIHSLLREEPLSLEEMTSKIMRMYKITDSFVSYALTKATIQAYMAELERERLVEIRVAEGIARVYVVN